MILVQSTAVEGLNVEISIDEVYKSHRLNRLRKNKEIAQPIIVKNTKNEAFSEKKLFFYFLFENFSLKMHRSHIFFMGSRACTFNIIIILKNQYFSKKLKFLNVLIIMKILQPERTLFS